MDLSERVPCPRCGGSTWLEEVRREDWALRCLCGLMKFVIKEVSGAVYMHRVVKSKDVVLPQKGTKIHLCFSAVAGRYPEVVSTANVASLAGLKTKETAALLVSLLSRGLLVRVSSRQGSAGGSIWALTDDSIDGLGIRGRVYGTSVSITGGA